MDSLQLPVDQETFQLQSSFNTRIITNPARERTTSCLAGQVGEGQHRLGNLRQVEVTADQGSVEMGLVVRLDTLAVARENVLGAPAQPQQG